MTRILLVLTILALLLTASACLKRTAERRDLSEPAQPAQHREPAPQPPEPAQYMEPAPQLPEPPQPQEPPAQASRFARTEGIAGQYLVTDSVTGLMWQGCAAGRTGSTCPGPASTFTWQEALDYCRDLTWADFTDWYLPNLDELRSIVDENRSSAIIDATAFGGIAGLYFFWSSTSRDGDASRALHVDFNHYGHVDYNDKAMKCAVRCVRRGP